MRAALALPSMVGGSETNNTEFMALNDFPAWYAQFSAPPWSLGRDEIDKSCLIILLEPFLCNMYLTLHEKSISQLLRPSVFF